MKKFLSMLMIASLALFAAVGCSDDDDNTPPPVTKFKMSVSQDGNVTYQDNPDFTTTATADDITVAMTKVKFADDMPMYLDIVLPNIVKTSEGIYGATTVTPTAPDGTPYPIVRITDVTVTTTDNQLKVNFTCFMTILNATYNVEYCEDIAE